jgi:RNA polymerase sigma-70 factor (ECF subfamily)
MPVGSAVHQVLSSSLSDCEFARRIAAGDQLAFEVLMRKHNRVLYRTARAILRDDAEAEDALQSAYLNAYRSIGDFRSESKLSTWLTRIVVNEALMRARKRGTESAVIPLESVTDEEGNILSSEGSTASIERPDAAAMRGEIRTLIERKIDALPDVFRTVFVLRALEELSVDETAVCLGIPEATVRTRFFRARSLLRESLAREVDYAIDGAFAFAGSRCERIVSGVLHRLRSPDTT